MTDAVDASLRAAELIESNPSEHRWITGSHELAAEAERRLGVAFPPSYRTYVSAFGAGIHHHHEIFGTVPDLGKPQVPNVVWFNEKARADLGLPPEWLIVMSLDDSSAIALHLEDDEEAGVFQIWPGEEGEDLVQGQVARSFGHFLLDLVERGHVSV